jgi:hypothetical protein
VFLKPDQVSLAIGKGGQNIKLAGRLIGKEIDVFRDSDGSEEEIVQRATVLKYVLKKMLALLHPFTPFITEEIWEQVKNKNEDLLIIQNYPEFDQEIEFKKDQDEMNKFIDTIVGIRNLRQGVNLKPKDEVSVELFTDDQGLKAYYNENKENFDRLAKVTNLVVKTKTEDRPKKSVTNASSHTEVYLKLEGLIDLNEQIKRIEKELTKAKMDYENILKRLANQNFISNAPEAVVLELKSKDDVSEIQLHSGQEGTLNEANVHAQVQTFSDGFNLQFLPSNLVVNGKKWDIQRTRGQGLAQWGQGEGTPHVDGPGSLAVGAGVRTRSRVVTWRPTRARTIIKWTRCLYHPSS